MRFQKFSALLTWMVSLTSLALSLLVLVYKDASPAPQEVSVPADSVYIVKEV